MANTDLLLSERIAVMETELSHIMEQNRKREEVQVQTAKSIESLDAKMDGILRMMERYKGFIGGIMFVGSAIFAFLKMGIPWLMKLKGEG